MRTWDMYFEDVLPEVIGCPMPTVERHLLRAAQRFCSKTMCWRADLDRVKTRAGLMDFSIPRGAIIDKIIGAMLNGQPLDLEVPDASSLYERVNNRGGSRLITHDAVTFVIVPAPGADLEVLVEAILRPSDDAEGLPDAIGDRYSASIANGALATLLAMPKAEWTNLGRSEIKEAMFAADMGSVQARVWKGHTNKRPRSRAMMF